MSNADHVLPRGWCRAAIQDFAETSSGGTPTRKERSYYGGSIPWVKSGELGDTLVISRTSETITRKGLVSSSAKVFPKGTLCIALYGATVGKLGILGMDAATNQAVCGIFPAREIVTRYIFYALRYLRDELISQSKGGAQPNISQGIVRNTTIPLAPVNEQRRIVNRIETLEENSQRARFALEAIPPLLEKLRQSVLAAAFRGDLTADWRARNPDVEPASVLLERIRAERRRRWEEAELAKLRAKGRAPKDDRWKAKYKEPELVPEPEAPPLPPGWSWTNLDSLICDGPTNGYSPRTGADAKGSISLKLSATTQGRMVIDAHTTKRLYEDVPADSKYWLEPGDIVVQRANSIDYLGAAALFEGPGRKYIYPDLMMRIRTTERPLGIYIWRYLNSATSRKYFREKATGTAGNMPKINGAILRRAPIPLPPLPEVTRIAEILTQMFNLSGDIGRLLSQLVSQLSLLDNSILEKAFKGKLVSQEPHDEPASKLLERIRSESRSKQRNLFEST